MFSPDGLLEMFKSKVTIFNDIPEDNVNPRRFERFVINKCQVYGGYVTTSDNSVQNVVNAQTVITKDIEHYKPPVEYIKLPEDERDNYYTVQIGDFIVFGEIDDIVTDANEFSKLQQKYKKNGIKVTTVNANIYGMEVDNVTMTNA